ncbi:acyl-CoA:lysophosphatidylglycerol acyltransferase 1-like [Saccoglossus kowalevskii]|uniref:Acyl-CoA:lysophosphatidylglycerol acyltransferase 1-like n=1 Tax=Saccoglossus kowalevskii TaxID=10224 RepID=A0ABM0MKE1_SACKO|nr:PREDICTED: acyl-CoA:lysophosphatidylglycerol acyltransferase 1-like [Saccoglossus kowalevskii]
MSKIQHLVMSLLLVIKVIIRCTLITAQHIYVLAYFCYLLLLMPLRWSHPKLYWTIEGKLFKWLLTNVAAWGWSANYTVFETGMDISAIQDDEAVIMVNHQSTGDVLTLMTCLQHKGKVLSQVMWLMDKLFLCAPFGTVSYIHGDFFIQQGKQYRDQQVKLLRNHLMSTYWTRYRKWLILFPEGGFLRKRRAGNQKYAKKNKLPVFEHVTLPRLGAMKTIMDTLRHYPDMAKKNGFRDNITKRQVKWIIDMTIGYPGYPDIKPMNVQTWVCGWREPCQTVVHYRYYPINDVPVDEDGLMRWLYQRFEEKEELLLHFYKTGKFPTQNMNCNTIKPQQIKLPFWWLLKINIFYACSVYLWIQVIKSGLSYLCFYLPV